MKYVTRLFPPSFDKMQNHNARESIHASFKSVADLGGGFRGFNPPPPPLGLPSKNLMCIEKRHHNNYVQTHTVCSYSTLSQAQPQTIGFNPPPPPPWAAKDVIMVSIALVDARKTSFTGVQNGQKKSARPLRGS